MQRLTLLALIAPLVVADTNYFSEFENTLKTLQTTFWNGKTWSKIENYQHAVLDTLLAASDISFTNGLQEYNGNVPGANPPPADSPSALIQKYFAENTAAFDHENIGQLFGDANDDMQWVVLEWLEVIKFINRYDNYNSSSNLGKSYIPEFAHRAHVFYNQVQKAYDTSLCNGGLTWQPKLATYKNAITNELFISSSAKMYLYFPGDSNTNGSPGKSSVPVVQAHDQSFLDNAKKEYDWFRAQKFENNQGLITDGFHISKGQTTCDQRNDMVYTYNQGVMLEGLRYLWESTGDASYLNDGYVYVKSVMDATGWNNGSPATDSQWKGIGRNGYLEDFCDMAGSCSNDGMLFKGIYFHNLDLFCEPLPTESALIPGVSKTASTDLASSHAAMCSGYTSWIKHNADGAISTRDPKSNVIAGWWAAKSVNMKRSLGSPKILPPVLPPGAVDIINQPWILESAEWKCNDNEVCNPNGERLYSLKDSAKFVKRATTQRTTQTQGSGLGVIKAASDFTLKRPAF